ncbi:endopeptidase La [Longimicrobium sp.]|uniref:endopeptidase La n=1 Tax=Longimicrobium sp. TaxID=2029185 RepID=UPI002C0288B3|nr:endopeptidase La [Longimicrobium sp.]HSU17777.1 endopeptidase La [Longimicrobium sp.]
MSERTTLPVLPLRETVVFPGTAVPISAGRPGTLQAIEAALAGDRRMLAVAQKENRDEVEADNLYLVGTVVRIAQVQRGGGGVQLLIHGEHRAMALQYLEGPGGLSAHVREMSDLAPVNAEDPAFIALYRELRDRAAELGKRRGIPPEMLQQFMDGIQEPGQFADLVAFYVEMNTEAKQKLLEVLSVEERLRSLLLIVQRQLALIEAQEEIQQQVQEELGERQREMLLREQMKAIQRELGEEDEGREIEELREKLESLDLSETGHEEAMRELARLERTNPQSAEYQVIRTYLEWITDLPWNLRTEDQLDLNRGEEILNEDHYGLEDVKDRVLEFLAVRQLAARRAEAEVKEEAAAEAGTLAAIDEAAREPGEPIREDPIAAAFRGEPVATAPAAAEVEVPAEEPEESELEKQVREAKARATAKGPILLFAGPPGVGKTSIAKSIARALGRKYVRIALGGVRDEADIRGHRRTYVGAMPGRIVQALKQAKSRNPVILLDEVDKLGVSYQGDPSSALLEVLDPAQNHEFTDHYLGVPFDLSEVLFIATANYAQNIPAPLYDRMEAVEFRGYTEMEKKQIALRYLIPRQLHEAGLAEGELEVSDEALQAVISEYTREAGVRQLEREVGKLARKAARRIASGTVEQVKVDGEVVKELLGRTRVHPERANGEDQVGVATGMYYTPTGGDIMFIEVSAQQRTMQSASAAAAEGEAQHAGFGNLVLTGQLGDVMKESARAALTYARANAVRYGIDPRKAWGSEIHIHVPAGAIPKDGPSAGVALSTALVSVLSGTPVRADVSMTGEVTLTGRVLPIGGVKEKLLGAWRAGIRTILLPRENEADLEDLPREVLDQMEIHPVGTIDEALSVALRGASFSEGKLRFPELPLPPIAGSRGMEGEVRMHGGRER